MVDQAASRLSTSESRSSRASLPLVGVGGGEADVVHEGSESTSNDRWLPLRTSSDRLWTDQVSHGSPRQASNKRARESQEREANALRQGAQLLDELFPVAQLVCLEVQSRESRQHWMARR